MTPERMADLVARWVRFYTRDLPTPIRQRRVSEIAADLHDQIAHERAQATSDRRIAANIASRMVRGLAADASWRKANSVASSPAHRSLLHIVLVAAGLLSVPLVAMQVTDEVAWGAADFAAAGTLIVGTGLLLRAAARKAGDLAYRAAVGVALAAALLLIWMNLAVGVIAEPDDRANVMYVGVLAVGILGAITARFRSDGMARALLATAIVQTLVGAIALSAGKHDAPGSSIAKILALNGLFAGLFIGSAVLFRHAARKQLRVDERPQQ
jgi:hypothetical protein